jgi:uncharacterized protein (TIGR00251 family)
MLLLRSHNNGVTFECRVSPRASRTTLKAIKDGILQIALAAPPIEGRANEALIAFFAEFLRIPRSRIAITGGEHGRTKRVFVQGISGEIIVKKIEGVLQKG